MIDNLTQSARKTRCLSASEAPKNPYLIDSPHAADRGQKIGTNPAFLSTEALQGLRQPQSPIKAIKAHCVTCSGGSHAEANKCTATGCSLWAFRMGRNPFHARSKQRSPSGRNIATAEGPS